MSLYLGPNGAERLGDVLRRELQSNWTSFRFAVAYAKLSGVDHIHDVLTSFAASAGHSVIATVGIDQQGSSYEALHALHAVLAQHGHSIFVCSNPRSQGSVASPTFHPKLWLFDDGARAMLITGSGNLTQGGLYSNYEVGTVQPLDLQVAAERATFDAAVAALSRWADTTKRDVKLLDATLLNDLSTANLVLSEDEIRRANRSATRSRTAAGGRHATLGKVFDGEDFQLPPAPQNWAPRTTPPAPAAPATPAPPAAGAAAPATPPTPPAPIVPQHGTFYIHLTPAARTEIYLAKAPLREDPAFFGLPFTGLTTPRNTNNPPQPQANPWPLVDVTIYDATGAAHTAQAHPTKMWQYVNGPNANEDVRIYFSKGLQDIIVAGSVMVISRDPRPGIEYDVSVYPPNHPQFATHDAYCVNALPNSPRKYGWS